MIKPSGGSSRNVCHIKKPMRKTKIGGSVRLLEQRRKSRRKSPLASLSIVQLDAANGLEPCDKFNKGLWGCATEEMVQAQFDKWWKGFNRKARRGTAHRRISPKLQLVLDALLDQPGATSAPLLNNQMICTEAYKILKCQLAALISADPDIEVGFVTFICGTGGTSHYRPIIELFESQRKVQRTLRAMSDNFFGITEIVLFNSHSHSDGGQLVQRHEHALIWGKDIIARASVVAMKHASHFSPNITGAHIIDVKKVSVDEVNLTRMSAYLFKPPYKCLTWNPLKDGKKGHMHASEKADRYIRYLRLLQLRSMMSVENVTFGAGEGQRIRSDMVKYLRAFALKEGAGILRVIHPDAVSSFWVDLARELNLVSWGRPIVPST